MDVTLFGLCLLTSEKPLYSHLIFEENGWRFWIKPVQNAVDEWEVNFVKDRGHGDEARGKLTFFLNREERIAEYKAFELRETLFRDVTVQLAEDKSTLQINLQEPTSVLKGFQCDYITEYHQLIFALLELEVHIEKLLIYRE